eukprot:14179441-Alexandrium_andersonii.AAC.1
MTLMAHTTGGKGEGASLLACHRRHFLSKFATRRLTGALPQTPLQYLFFITAPRAGAQSASFGAMCWQSAE